MAACEGLIIFGGRGEPDTGVEFDAVSRFNREAMDNAMFGRNLILERLASFDNSSKFKEDLEPELDEYVQTLFIEPLGDHGYDINGDPYGKFKEMQAEMTGEEVKTENSYAENAADFMASFGEIFGKKA